MVRYYLLSGQSNARGRAPGGDFTISPLVKVWNNRNDISDLTNLGTAWVTPDRNANPFVSSWNNFAVHAANQIALATGDEVRLVIVAKGGLNIGNWYMASTRQAMLLRMVAVLDAAGVTAVDGFWWHQGEGDNSTATSTYLGRWNAIKTALTNDGYMTASTPVVMGEATASHTGTNATLAACLDSRTRLAPIKNFDDIGDGTHFSGVELVRIGLVYAGLQMLLEA